MEGTHDGDAAVLHDSRIEIEVRRFALVNHGRPGSEWTIELAARARIVLPGAAGQGYLRNWRYSGPKRRYFGVAPDEPVLRADLDTAFEVLADRMVYDLLITTAPEARPDKPAPGTAWTVGAARSWTSSPYDF